MRQFQLDDHTAKRLPWLVATAFFMQMLDGSILNTALPSIAAAFQENPLRLQAVLIAYMVTVAIVIPASGWLTDRFGAKNLMSASVGLFTLASLLCALAPTLNALIAFRVLQAVGGALMTPVGRLVILRTYPRAQFIQVLSFVTMPGLLGSLTGPALGGFLVEYATWHWIFLINLPIGILGVVMTRRLMPTLDAPAPHRFDKSGFAVFAASLVAITLALEGAGGLGLSAGQVAALFAVGLLGQAVYWLWLAKKKFPLFPRRLFRTLGFSIGLAGNLLTRLGTGATPFLIPLFLQVVLGYPPSAAGLLMMPLALASLLTKMLAKPLTVRYGYRLVLIVNTLLQGLLILALSTVTLQMSILLFVAHLSVLGAVNSLQFSVLNTYTLLELPDEEAGGGNALLSAVIQIAQSLAVGVAALVLFRFTGDAVPDAAGKLDILRAFHHTFTVIGLVSIASSLLFLFAPRDHKKRTYRSGAGAS